MKKKKIKIFELLANLKTKLSFLLKVKSCDITKNKSITKKVIKPRLDPDKIISHENIISKKL
jgi:hypothetical protein